MKRISLDIERAVCELYSDGYGTTELAKIYNLCIPTISNILNRNNIIKYKGKKPQYKYNTKYFSEYTNDSCYWAGFIYADGCITDANGIHKVHIGLNKNDEQHLLNLSKAINFNGNLFEDKANNAKILSISGKYFIKDLKENFNIIPKKSLIIEFPKQIPNEKIKHFIRGIFDGDGTITINKNKGSISIVGNLSTINNIVDIFFNLVKIKKYGTNDTNKPSIQKYKNVYSVTYHNYNAKTILDWLYSDSNFYSRLERKYNKYNIFFSKERMLDKRIKNELLHNMSKM